MERKNMPLGMVVGRMIQEMFRILKKRAAELSDVKLTGEQFGMLHVINIKGESFVQQDFANMMGKDKSAILRLIDSLEEKKLVLRVVDSTDRRKNCLHVTELGKEIIQQYLDIESELSKELTSGIPEADMNTFYRVIATIRRNAENI